MRVKPGSIYLQFIYIIINDFHSQPIRRLFLMKVLACRQELCSMRRPAASRPALSRKSVHASSPFSGICLPDSSKQPTYGRTLPPSALKTANLPQTHHVEVGWEIGGGRSGFVVSHPWDKYKNVPRMGHPSMLLVPAAQKLEANH